MNGRNADGAAAIHDDVLLSMVGGIGARTYQQLLKHFGSATAILNVGRNELAGFDFPLPEAKERLLNARKEIDPALVIEFCRRSGIRIVPLADEQYPAPLRTIHDPPPILYVRGELLPSDAFSIAVIGTRRADRYGQRQTERLTSALVQHGFTIISGLALGIDGVAHRTAINAGGRTIAVLGSGLRKIYPPEHVPLAEQIVQHGGCLISEYPPLHPSAKWTFPQRNRIVSGLSLGVLVIQAPRKSGAMISARLAGEQGRDVFAVPGPIESPNAQGCNQLIRDGAYLVESADDILNVLGPMHKPVSLPGFENPVRHPNEIPLNEIEQLVLRQFGSAAKTLDAVADASGLEPLQVAAALGVLTKKRILRQIAPTEFIRM